MVFKVKMGTIREVSLGVYIVSQSQASDAFDWLAFIFP